MQYVKECLQLLYWIYFKPYTLKRHVRAICPEITDPYLDNYYRRTAAARNNPRLKRYDDQCWWLAVLAPIIAVFLCVPLAEGVARLLSSSLHFNWWVSSFFLFSWLLGQVLVRAIRNKLGEKTAWLVIIAAMLLMFASAFLLKQLVADPFIRKAAFGVVVGVAFGVAFGVAGGVILGLAGGLAVGVALGVTLGLAGGVVAGGVAFGVALGVAVGVAGGVAGGVALGVSFVFGVLRVYFWLPELLWMLFLKLAPVPPVRRLRFLPPQFDQLIILPLPFLPGLIAAAYQENQAAARQCISYLISSTNQQKTAGKAMLLIAAESFSRCGSAKEIAGVREQLDWLPAELAGKITACLELSQDTAAALEASSPYRQEERLKQVCGKHVLTLSGFAGELADQLIRSARQAHRLTLPQPDRDGLARDPFVALRHWMDAVEQAADGKTFLLCLDEFERIEEIVTATGSRAPLNFLRHLIQHRSRWTLLFAGAHTPEELSPHWSDCLINTRALRVSCLDKDDAMELIIRPVEDFPDIWTEDAAEAVWQLTQGQPFLIQLLCQEAVDCLNRKKAKTVQVSDVEAVIPAAFEHGHYYFDEFQRALTDGQRALLRALAKGEQITPDLAAAAPVLLRKEVLVQENSGWVFRVPLLGRRLAGTDCRAALSCG